MNIIARKPRDNFNEYIVVDRGAGHAHPFVSAVANKISLAGGEWFWGNYFATKGEAIAHFNSRSGAVEVRS